MKKEIRSILNDLYKLDESFKANEKELIILIEKLLSVKPDIKIDPKFARSLKAQLMEKAGEPASLQFNLTNMLRRWLFPFAGGVLTTVLVVAVILSLNTVNKPIVPYQINEDMKAKGIAHDEVVTQLQDNAFGTLSDTAQPAPERATATAPMQAAGLGGAEAVNSGGAVAKNSMIMPPYMPQQYKYIYKGDAVELKDVKVAVYHRKSGSVNDSSFINAAKSFGFGAIDLSGFNNLSAQNFSMIQNVKNGYNINIDFTNQNVSIYQNWSQWEQPYTKCGNDQKCIKRLQLKPSDVPDDADITAISDKFLKEHNVDMSSYGQPVVIRYWENQSYDNGTSQLYIADDIQVIYPLRINGMPAVGEGGDPYGLNVSVNIREKKVSNANNIRMNDFDSSDYDAVTDFGDVTKFAENGGSMYAYDAPEGSKIIEAEYGNPERVVEVLNRPDKDNSGVYTEYFVPALKFPINKKPDTNIYQNYIIVPLAKEMLKRDESVAVPLTRTEPGIATDILK